MLYVTTRDSQDAFTAIRTLSENRCPEGGFFVPMRLPYYDAAMITSLAENSFSRNAADTLNLLFGTRLDGWAVEFAIGRYPVKLVSLNGKITVAETWHNPLWRFERLASGMEKAVRQSDRISRTPSNWLMIASRVAVLFGLFGQFLESGMVTGEKKMDIAVPSRDLSALMAVWYARKMGLPIGTIVCCCNENDSLWNLFNKGELRTDLPAARTCTPDCDCTVPTNLEHLIFETLGRQETKRFCEICRTGGIYCLEPEQVQRLGDGINVRVVSGRRLVCAIPNLYAATGFVADPYTALAYCGLIDYRAGIGESRCALILAEESPTVTPEFIAACMNITPAELKLLLD